MKPNTDYGIRVPGNDEIRGAFGALAACVRVTGGDLHIILFYLNNTGLIAGASEVPADTSDYAKSIIAEALAESAAVAWAAEEKPTIKAVSKSLGVCTKVARRALVSSGKLPA